MSLDPTLTTLFFAGLAAAAAPLGVLPFVFGRQPGASVGAAYALPSGVMVGAAYLLGTQSLQRSVPAAAIGALLGLSFIYWTSRYTQGESAVDSARDPADGYRQILQDALHSGFEGVAIGVAMAVNLAFGTFVALALAVHNIGEGMALTEYMRHRGMSLGECAGLSVAAKLSQPLLAVATLAVLSSVPSLIPGALSLASGALFSLVVGELVPAAYRHARRRFIAVLLSGSAAAVLLFEDLLL